MAELIDRDTIILAIESAIAGGSICLWSADREIDSLIGDGGVSRAEDVLLNIAEMLERNSLSRQDIGKIAVSIGPGSFTGIRIGIATGLGLKNALKIPCVGVSALEAFAKAAPSGGRVVAALPMGRNAICFQGFDMNDRAKPASIFGPLASRTPPGESLAGLDLDCVIAHSSIRDFLEAELPIKPVYDAGTNISALIAREAADGAQKALEPIFLSLAA